MVGLASCAALSAALLTPLPLLVALVAEAAYLLFVPDTKWYTDRLETKFDAEVADRREDLKKQVFPTVRNEVRDQFQRLEDMRAQIATQSRKEETWFREALRKLDFLMEKFLQFAAKEAQFAGYLMFIYSDIYDDLAPDVRRNLPKPNVSPRVPPSTIKSTPPRFEIDKEYAYAPMVAEPTAAWVNQTVDTIQKFYSAEVEQLGKDSETDPVIANRNVMIKRKQILERRREFVSRIGQILSNLGQQMRLVSDTFGLINDEIRARSPEQVLADIDEVVVQTTSLTEAIDEITPMDELVADPTSAEVKA